MAMINCPECGKEVSDKAKTCPSCGAPLTKKFCPHCGEKIDVECVVCPKCGKQVEKMKSDNIIINNSASSSASASARQTVYVQNGRPKNKWVAFFLCLIGGMFGLHKFYEGKIIMGILYLFTAGLFFVGWLIDLFVILTKPNPYYV